MEKSMETPIGTPNLETPEKMEPIKDALFVGTAYGWAHAKAGHFPNVNRLLDAVKNLPVPELLDVMMPGLGEPFTSLTEISRHFGKER